jgi:hypothetical protein
VRFFSGSDGAEDAADTLIFRFGFRPADIENMSVAEIGYWITRAAIFREKQKR